MLQKILMSCMAMCLFYFTVAQTNKSEEINTDSLNLETPVVEESKPKPIISGSVDIYYKYDWNKQLSNNKTSFTNSHNSFELGSARLKVQHTISKVDMVAELAFGKRAEEFSYNDANTQMAIRQLYASYSFSKNFKITAGEFATHFNNEVFEPDANRNYSMSYMFTYGPFFHTGIKAEAVKGKHGFMLGIANPNDYKTFSNAKKYIIGQYTYSPTDNFKAYVNYFTGQRPADSAKVSQVETILTQKFSDKFNITYLGSIAFNKHQDLGKYDNSKNWWCSGLYFNYDPTSLFGLTLRTEYFNDDKEQNVFAAFQGGGSLFETTLSANFRFDNLVLIPEIRFENATKEIFTKSNGAGTKTNGNFLVAAVYKF